MPEYVYIILLDLISTSLKFEHPIFTCSRSVKAQYCNMLDTFCNKQKLCQFNKIVFGLFDEGRYHCTQCSL